MSNLRLIEGSELYFDDWKIVLIQGVGDIDTRTTHMCGPNIEKPTITFKNNSSRCSNCGKDLPKDIEVIRELIWRGIDELPS